jgi:hypothetical protein
MPMITGQLVAGPEKLFCCGFTMVLKKERGMLLMTL